MARTMAERKGRSFPGLYPDLLSAAFYAVVLSARDWDASVGCPFVEFARMKVRWEFLDLQRRCLPWGLGRRAIGRSPAILSIEEVIASDGEDLTVGDTLPNGEDPVGWELCSIDMVRHHTRHLQARSREAIRLHLTEARGRTVAETAAILGVCQSRASELITGGLRELAG